MKTQIGGRLYAMLIAFASLVAMVLSWIAPSAIRTTLHFSKAWVALHMTPNLTAGRSRFSLLEFRWVRTSLNSAGMTLGSIFSFMATTATTPVLAMIQNFGFTAALRRYTSAIIAEARGLALFTTMAGYGNKRGSPDGYMLSGTRPGLTPHLYLSSPVPA